MVGKNVPLSQSTRRVFSSRNNFVDDFEAFSFIVSHTFIFGFDPSSLYCSSHGVTLSCHLLIHLRDKRGELGLMLQISLLMLTRHNHYHVIMRSHRGMNPDHDLKVINRAALITSCNVIRKSVELMVMYTVCFCSILGVGSRKIIQNC